ncbi:MAG TPA: TonB-dependent receptor [Rhizomicrobium sp.]|nr:TonB-dependent receptor [Rhizomicrobium sp.]
MKARLGLLAVASLFALPASAQQMAAGEAPEHVVVYGTLPDSDIGQVAGKVPGELQSIGANQLTAQHGATLLDALGNQTAGVSLSDTQGNGSFQDLRFHGFEASPLQGVAQGVAVYQNGVRLNEAFGDTVNWDAIPETAIARMDVWSSNPVFGLNALGGAVNLVMKNGFTWQGTALSAQGGTYGHGMGTAQYGFTDGDLSLYGAAEAVTDSGWRLHSPSDILRLYADTGWRIGNSELHLAASGSLSALGVVGPAPIELLRQASTATYSYPQATHNMIGSLALNDKTRFSDNWQLEASVFVRALRQRHVDGNDGNFESCSSRSSFGGDICLQDDAFGTPAGGKTTAFRNQFVIMNGAGQVFPYDAAITYGALDRTFTDSVTQGGTLQVTGNQPLFGLSNYFTAGGSVDHSTIAFQSNSMLAREFSNLNVAVDSTVPGAGNIVHTLGNLGYAPVSLGATTNYYGIYAVDALDLTDALTITAGLRINAADIKTRDRSGAGSELNGNQGYGHVNPLAGVTYKFDEGLSLFGGYSEANRAPTPLELDCASPIQPCLLEGSLVADPPLAQVVSHSWQAGARGALTGLLGDDRLNWSATFFRTDSDNDIVALASTIAGRGYFTNVPLTRRQGADLVADYQGERWSAYASYSYLDATYQFTGTLASPNNPNSDANGNVQVTPGRHIPMTPANTFKAGVDVTVTEGLSLGGELVLTGSQYFDGDPSNLNSKLPGHVIVNLRAAYDITPEWQVFGLVDNVFDNHSATFGTYFQPDDTAGLLNPPLSDPRTLTLAQPITFQLGLKLKF